MSEVTKEVFIAKYALEEEREACAKVADGEAHADCEVAEQIARFIRGRR